MARQLHRRLHAFAPPLAVAAAAAILLVALSGTVSRAQNTAAPPSTVAAAADPPAVSIIVRTRRAADLDRVAAYAVSRGYAIEQRSDGDLPALRIAPLAGSGITQAVTDFTGRSGVEYVEPAYRMASADVPADPLYSKEASYLNIEKAPQAWDVEKGSPSVIVAVVDTGIDLSHPDLQGRIWTNPREIPNNGVDDDGDGCIDDVNGCGFVSLPSPGCSASLNGYVHDDIGHGTFVSGIIAADGNNGQGIVGVARGVQIMPVKVLDCNGVGDSLQVAEGILYAAKAGANVINMSLGSFTDSAFLHEAIRIVHDQYGVLVVAASGNNGAEGVAFPARYPGVLAVGAASAANPDKRALFSTTGPEIAVVAVGEGIVGTVPRSSCGVFLKCLGSDPYAVGDGTSFAAPQVTGLVALMLSKHRSLKPDQIISIVKGAATSVPAGDRPSWSGAGRVDMFKAITAKTGFTIGAPGLAKN